jgi:hypothetical protein
MEKLFRLRQSSGNGRIINKSDGTEVCLLELSTGTAGEMNMLYNSRSSISFSHVF